MGNPGDGVSRASGRMPKTYLRRDVQTVDSAELREDIVRADLDLAHLAGKERAGDDRFLRGRHGGQHAGKDTKRERKKRRTGIDCFLIECS